MSEYRPRSRGGLVTSKYALPPTFSIGSLPDVPVTPSRFRGQRTGVSPSWEGQGSIMAFPNLNAAANSLMSLGRSQMSLRRSQKGKAEGESDDDGTAGGGGATPNTPSSTPISPGMSTTVPKKRKTNPLLDDPVDAMGDPGAPSQRPGSFLQHPGRVLSGPVITPPDQRAPWLEGSTRGHFSIQDEIDRLDNEASLRPGYVNPDPTKRTPWLPGSAAGTFPTQAEMEKLSPVPFAPSNTDKKRGKPQGGLKPGSLQRSLNRYQ